VDALFDGPAWEASQVAGRNGQAEATRSLAANVRRFDLMAVARSQLQIVVDFTLRPGALLIRQNAMKAKINPEEYQG
jgi:hypothetical protein